MSDENTPRLQLPMIVPGQAQKELSHNDALATLDMLVQGSVVAGGLSDPPASPLEGEAWIVGAAPTAAWAGHATAVAGWTGGGWRFVTPRDGMALWVITAGCFAQFTAGIWSIGVVAGTALTIDGVAVVGPQHSAIGDVTGGTIIDAEARSTLAALLAALRGHGLIAS